ncbi:hypothetical protein [uncultured Dubosiella sp.]|uniref:hypothetical protein n=1 Tax=uncultured Dubosiella sp. TaxID=1937011 RepID=UPI0032B2A0F3
MKKDLLIPDFVEHWEKDRKEREEIRVTMEMAERRELISMVFLAVSAGMMVSIGICLALIARGILW